MRRDKEGNIIGVGEDTAVSIIHDLFNDDTKIIPQYPLVKILTKTLRRGGVAGELCSDTDLFHS